MNKEDNRRIVEVLPYNPYWKDEYEQESEKLKRVFGQELVNIYHIGSTSIPGLSAKPIIDILIEVRDIGKIDAFNLPMITLGYAPMGEHGIKERRFFIKGGNNRTHHIHIFEISNSEIEKHLNFRDYMIAHPKELKEYECLKLKLSQIYRYDIEGYVNGKNSFISDIDIKAKDWAKMLNKKE